jgi:Divergent InlB B-repeat domain/Bacterial Ig domain
MTRTPLIRTAISMAVITLVAACGGGDPGSAPREGVQASTAREGLAAVKRKLTVNVVGGTGQVFTTVGGVDCTTANCSGSFDEGTVVGVRAVPAPGYAFDAWQESHSQACNDNIACNVTMNADKTVTARFVQVNPLTSCNVTRSNASTPMVAAAHPKVLFTNSEFKDCMQRKFSAQAPEATRFKAEVDRVMNGGSWDDFQPWWPALVYQATGDLRYAKFAVKSMDNLIKAEEVKIAAGQTPDVAYDSYLHSDFYIAGLAMVYDWVPHHAGAGDSGTNDQLTPEMRARWIAYGNQAVWNIWKAPVGSNGKVQAVWGGRTMEWSGWGRDNPANNYYYHFMNGLMHLALATHGENPQAQEWLTLFRNQKVENELHPLLRRDLVGGGSREGTGYGTTARLIWTMYDAWERSTGESLANKTPYPKESMAHLLHSIVPTMDRMAPTGDHSRDETAALYDYQRDYLLELITLLPQEPVSGVAKKMLASSSVPRMRYARDNYADLMYAAPQNVAERDGSALSTTYWGEGTGQFMMRSAWDVNATYSNFICGPYTESHAHRDQGSFVVFRNDWLAHDRNQYSTSGIEQDLEAHNLVRLKTSAGAEIPMLTSAPLPCRVMALADNAQYTYMSADITPSYSFRRADLNHYNNHLVKKLQREYLFIRPSTFIVMDRVESTVATQQVWTMNLPKQPTVQGSGFTVANNASSMQVFGVSPAGATPTVSSQAGRATNWRVEVQQNGTAANFLHVLGTNGSVLSAAPANADGKVGTRIVLADGRVVTARFPTAELGGELEILAANGAVELNAPLPKTIAQPAVMAADAPPPVRPAPAPYVPSLPSSPAPSPSPTPTPAPGPTPSPSPTPSPAPTPTPAPSPIPAPQISLPAALDGAAFLAGVTVQVPVTLSSTQNVTRVELLRNNTKIAEVTAAPYQFAVAGLALGSHKLEARVVLSNGTTKKSTAINVQVETPAPAPTNNVTTLRQGLAGYSAVTDVGVSNQYLQYNPKGVVSNDSKTGIYKISGGDPYEVRTFMRFGGMESLAGRRVVKAELALNFNFGATGYVLSGKYLTGPWSVAATNFGWSKRTDSLSWAAPGSGAADWVTGAGFQVTGFTGAAADARKVLLDPAIVQGWIDNPLSNFGFVLLNGSNDKTSFVRSSEDSNAAYRPTLQIWFE